MSECVGVSECSGVRDCASVVCVCVSVRVSS